MLNNLMVTILFCYATSVDKYTDFPSNTAIKFSGGHRIAVRYQY